MKGRVSFIKELWDTCKFFFVAPESYDEKKQSRSAGKKILLSA